MSKQASSRDAVSRPSVLFLPCYRDQRMLDGICQLAHEADWILDTLCYHTDLVPSSWSGEGILCMMQVPHEGKALRAFLERHSHIPTVGLSMNDPSLALPRVLQDNAEMGRMAAEHLVSRGCRALGFVMHTPNAFHRERLNGFMKAANDLGHPAVLIDAPSDYIVSGSGAEWFTSHISVGQGPFGVMAAGDYLSQWVIRACNEAALSIPEDVALLGVDNCTEICELSSIGISSIDNNAFQHGYQAARLLNELMQGKGAPKDPIVVPAGALHVRASTDIMATRHPHVARALHYIDENLTDPDLTPRQVAAVIPMSARRLHDAFAKHVGRSIYQEITYRRIQHALALVQTTSRKLWDIAEASGFSSAEHMSRLFRKRLGHPPSSYRQ